MKNEFKDIVVQNSIDFCTTEMVDPVIRSAFSSIDLDCFNVFTAELAEIFDDYLPNYFGFDHKKYIGEYFYSSLYGDALPLEMLKEIIVEVDESGGGDIEENDPENFDVIDGTKTARFDGLEVSFSSQINSIKVHLEIESIRETRFHFDSVYEVIIVKTIEYLNSKRK